MNAPVSNPANNKIPGVAAAVEEVEEVIVKKIDADVADAPSKEVIQTEKIELSAVKAEAKMTEPVKVESLSLLSQRWKV